MLKYCIECDELHMTNDSPLWCICPECWDKILREREKEWKKNKAE